VRLSIGSAIELLGFGLVVAGIALWSVPVAIVAAGVACVFLAQGIGGES